jgi:Rrf2 family transcriptional regulator, iron-sulfur cluster assembly transcription factor
MSILFSRQCEYAIQAVLYLALQGEGERVPTNALTKRLKIPYHFLGKILQRLTGKGLLRSEKGPRGGFSLALPAEDITLFHIVEAIDGAAFTRSCVLGFPECSGKNPCSVHHAWGAQRDQIYQMLVSRNIAEMADDMKRPEYKRKKI